MSDLKLPQDLVGFLNSGQQLSCDYARCEAGLVGLKRLDQLSLGEVWIEPGGADDPHMDEEGYYAVPAVSLTGECRTYEPEYILLWLPDMGAYGTWDNDHWVLQVFPGVTWTDIAADPLKYINAQWAYPDAVAAEVVKPYPMFPFKKGCPF